jgi:hypothetical protein
VKHIHAVINAVLQLNGNHTSFLRLENSLGNIHFNQQLAATRQKINKKFEELLLPVQQPRCD